jgi:squalene-hopene/tetraprenyl-beta-curcumene cyclase
MLNLKLNRRVLGVICLAAVSIGLTLFGRMDATVDVRAAEAAPPEDAEEDEPLAREFSLELATRSLDSTASHWAETRRCAACHTIPPYLMARPLLPGSNDKVREIRAFVERIVTDRLESEPQIPPDGISAILVQVATSLAVNDRLTTERLHPVTRQALDRMWTQQRDDGTWEWPFRDVPPIKIDEHYGVTLVAIGVGMAPDGYAETDAARAGLDKIRRYLSRNPPVSLHQQAMVAWAGGWIRELIPLPERAAIVDRMFAAQRPDGGWSLASLVATMPGDANVTAEWRELQARTGYGTEFLAYVGRNGARATPLVSDGYATGFVIHVARQSGIAADDAHIVRGLEWLRKNQRQSGRWFTASQGNHTRNYLSNTGTAYAVMAMQECSSSKESARFLPP